MAICNICTDSSESLESHKNVLGQQQAASSGFSEVCGANHCQLSYLIYYSRLTFGVMQESLPTKNCCIIVPVHFSAAIKILTHICSKRENVFPAYQKCIFWTSLICPYDQPLCSVTHPYCNLGKPIVEEKHKHQNFLNILINQFITEFQKFCGDF